MYAPQIVYATLQGNHPRQLGEDGSRERLVLPPTAYGDVAIKFEFFRPNEDTPLTISSIESATLYANNTSTNLTINPDQSIVFPPTATQGVVLIIVLTTTGRFITYPFRIARPAVE